MFFSELSTFLYGWRGFLVGQRRGWHAHHRWGITGYREGYLLPRGALQEGQLRRAGSLTVEVLARGGHIWGFGFGRASLINSSFTWWKKGAPGVLSNSFFSRIRRLPAVRQLRRLILLRPRRRKLSRRKKRFPRRRSIRLGKSRRLGTLSLKFARKRVLRSALFKTYLGVHFFRGFKTWKKGTLFPDLTFYSRFTRKGQVPRLGNYPTYRSGVHRGGWKMWAPLKIIPWLGKRVRWSQLRKTFRFNPNSRFKFTSGVSVSFKERKPVFFSVSKTRGHLRKGRQRNPNLRYRPRWVNLAQVPLPTIVLLGSTVGSTLHREVTRGGIPLLLVGEVEVVPTVGSLYPIWWNSASLEGPRYLWIQFETLSQRGSLFKLFWNRLTCLAEW